MHNLSHQIRFNKQIYIKYFKTQNILKPQILAFGDVKYNQSKINRQLICYTFCRIFS